MKTKWSKITPKDEGWYWFEGPDHGGPGLKHNGKLDKTLKFWPEKISIPE